MRTLTRLLTTAVASAALVVGVASSASANGTVTWRSHFNGLCLGHTNNNDAVMRGCSYGDAQWYDQLESDGSYTQHVNGDRSYCLAAYSDHDVYVEKCTANNPWQRFYEKYDNNRGLWRLQHQATGWYITVYDNGFSIGVDPFNEGDNRQWFA
ncbi:RICIN domain-containing protein [Streptomyces aureus]|uniref:RICIN domain-containing protein n=1 Tax=Streptomyces aureus TaxID=193461 RepID=UPI00055F8460|nr:RICIN domain-containing protein [Streptomyces aureus]